MTWCARDYCLAVRNPLLYEHLIPFPFVSLPFYMITRWTVSIYPIQWCGCTSWSVPFLTPVYLAWTAEKRAKLLASIEGLKKSGGKDGCKGFVIPIMIPGNAWRKEKKSNCQKMDETFSLWPIVPLRAVDWSHKARIPCRPCIYYPNIFTSHHEHE